MKKAGYVLSLVSLVMVGSARASNPRGMRKPGECSGDVRFNTTLTAFYPDYDSQEGNDGYLDTRGKKLRTLQDYVDGRTSFVTVALDAALRLPYGTPVCVPELERHFGCVISLQVRDSGANLDDRGFDQLDVCVRAEPDSYDNAVNRRATLVFRAEDLRGVAATVFGPAGVTDVCPKP